MSELNITKGEWKKAAGKHYCAIRTGSMEDGTGKVIADMRIVGGYDYNPYDAHLLAASPKLYAACEKALSALPIAGDSEEQEEARHIILSAMREARGEQP